jgi:CHASE1-domain containing sensor protein
MKQSFRNTLNILIVTAATLALTSPVHAQESAAPAQSSPAGVGILILLMGLAAIGLVAFAHLAQSRAARNPDENFEDE